MSYRISTSGANAASSLRRAVSCSAAAAISRRRARIDRRTSRAVGARPSRAAAYGSAEKSARRKPISDSARLTASSSCRGKTAAMYSPSSSSFTASTPASSVRSASTAADICVFAGREPSHTSHSSVPPPHSGRSQSSHGVSVAVRVRSCASSVCPARRRASSSRVSRTTRHTASLLPHRGYVSLSGTDCRIHGLGLPV